MRRLLGGLFMILVALTSCGHGEKGYPYKTLRLQDFSALRDDRFAVSNYSIRRLIDSLRVSERDTDYVDVMCNRYYAEHQPYLWISRSGDDLRSDTLVAWLAGLDSTGVPEARVYLPQLRRALKRLHDIDFDDRHTASLTMATVEYYMTKSLLRYASGLRFGFIHPAKLLNQLDPVDGDTTGLRKRTLCALPLEHPGRSFLCQVFASIRQHHIEDLLQAVQPQDETYRRLVEAYNAPRVTRAQRRILALNIERSRWRIKGGGTERYVIVNLPAQRLAAYDTRGDSTLTMKVCYGSWEHKTPLLASRLTKLELNPYWIIPQSIVRRSIIPAHLGDTTYFNNRRFKIIDRATGNVISPLHVTAEMLTGGGYFVRQDRGEDNSLGKMIFRFSNPFAIYLHDTNSREAFSQRYRAVSHGCIRLERPFDLARFLFADRGDDYIDRIRVAIDLPAETSVGRQLKEQGKDKELKTCTLEEPVGLLIVYYTAYPSASGVEYYPDVYGYDRIMASHLLQ
ncbi:MAG: L,D-transpeptidase family protein [Prevotellaceae bacterium]|nr:L,D-transpeptidase family protein [Prevotellaceae bacterium]MDY3855675.1 L,D-transpeptidase family protein [Bacteroidaceae bacterium]